MSSILSKLNDPEQLKSLVKHVENFGIEFHEQDLENLKQKITLRNAALRQKLNRALGFVPDAQVAASWQRVVRATGGCAVVTGPIGVGTINRLRDRHPLILDLAEIRQNDADLQKIETVISTCQYHSRAGKKHAFYLIYNNGFSEWGRWFTNLRELIQAPGFYFAAVGYQNILPYVWQKITDDPDLFEDLKLKKFYHRILNLVFEIRDILPLHNKLADILVYGVLFSQKIIDIKDLINECFWSISDQIGERGFRQLTETDVNELIYSFKSHYRTAYQSLFDYDYPQPKLVTRRELTTHSARVAAAGWLSWWVDPRVRDLGVQPLFLAETTAILQVPATVSWSTLKPVLRQDLTEVSHQQFSQKVPLVLEQSLSCADLPL